MKIWHVGAASSPYRVDGVSRTVWSLSRQQSQLGHQVSLVVDTPPEPSAVNLASEGGMRLIQVKASNLSYRSEIRKLLEEDKPEIVHMHSVFIVRQSMLGEVLNEMGIPYIITPHAGLAPQVLQRGVIKKSIYGWLRERPRFMGASAITLVTPAEEAAVRSFLPEFRKPIRWMPNPADVEQLDPHRWQGSGGQKRLVFLGRFDVLVKGIDILIEIARRLPEVKFDLYGTEDPKTRDWLAKLKENLPGNVMFHDPIFGVDKAKMLAGASFYIQPSRWEGFPVSVAECMYLGVPCAVAETLDLAQLFRQHDLGLVFPIDPACAAQRIRAALADENSLQQWSRAARDFAEKHFHPLMVAKNYESFYREILTAHEDKKRKATNGNGHAINGGLQFVPVHLRAQLKKNVSTVCGRLIHTNGHPRTVVLCYHSINRSGADLSIDPPIFREQLLWLRSKGFEFMNFGDLAHRLMQYGPPGNNVACITFDDGYEDNLTQAAPILSELGVPATMFVTSGLMIGQGPVVDHFHHLTHYPTTYLSKAQVGELARLGFEIGGHSHTHANLARIGRAQALEEVCRCKDLLEDAINGSIRSFAYPFGKRGIHYTADTVDVVRASGFAAGAAVAFRAVNARNSIHVYEIPRFFVARSDTPTTFEQKVRGHSDWLGAIQETTPLWLKSIISPEDQY